MHRLRVENPSGSAISLAVLAVAGLGAAVAAVAAVAAAAPLFDLGSKPPIEAVVAVDEIGMEPGGTGVLPIRIDFPRTHHLNSQPPPSFSIKEPSELKVLSVTLKGEHHFDEFLEVEVYDGTVTVMVEMSAAASISGLYTLTGELTYYPCSDADMTCFEQVDPVKVRVRVEPETPADRASEVGPVSESGSASTPPSIPAEGSSPLRNTGSTLADRITDSFAKSALLAYVLVFVGGILASFTPCVYPMIPITVAVIGAGSAGSRSRGFGLSLIYVLGIAITYSVFGAAAAGTGKAFGSFTQTFPVLLGIGLLLGVLGVSMFGFFEIQPPAFLARLQSKRGQGLIGVLLMGVVTGLVASPCLGPVLLALLAWIAKTGDVFRGFSLLFVFALGMGLLLVAIGTFAGALTALPKSGRWMVRVKDLLGLVLVCVGVYYVGLALAAKGVPEKATWTTALGVGVAVCGFLVKGSEKGAPEEAGGPAVSGIRRPLRKGVGVLMVVVGAYLAIVGLSMGGVAPSWLGGHSAAPLRPEGDGVPWSQTYEAGMDRAKAEGRPVMIDFYAGWCVYCKKLDSDVFTDESVAAEAARFVALRIDADRRKDLVARHQVLGLPTVVFLDSAGRETARIESYVKAEKFLERMKSVR